MARTLVPPTTAPRLPARTGAVAIGVVRSLRPKQWAKNTLVFAGVVFGGRLAQPGATARAVAVFGVFCALSSAAYLLNDVLDRDRDAIHPQKSRRPIASGLVSRPIAVVTSLLLALVGLGGATSLGGLVAGISAAYLALTLGYSLVLKYVLIVDLIALSVGYVLRAAVGAFAVGVMPSPWLLLCTTLLALFLGTTKRRHELLCLEGDAAQHRKVLDGYSPGLLDQMVSLVSSATVISYALYTFTSNSGRSTPLLVATFPFVLYGLFRYLYLVYRRSEGGAPEDLLFSDAPLLVSVVLWGLVAVGVLYWP